MDTDTTRRRETANPNLTPGRTGTLVAISISAGGVPKHPLDEAVITPDGVLGDHHAHEKHNRPDRAISLLDLETIHELNAEGFALDPGTAGENLTVEGLNLQELEPGTKLVIGEVVLRLERLRKPCYVLKTIDPRLEDAMQGRCGSMASVIQEGTLRAGFPVQTSG